MAQVQRSAAAQRDLEEIWDYIAQDNPVAADRLLRQIGEKADLYAENSGLGTPCFQLGPNLRSFAVGRYVAFFISVEDGIRIVRVLHSARDIPRVFGEEPFDA